MPSTAKKSILKGTLILAVVGIICKIVGVFFRIPLSKMLGDSGLAVYEFVYPTYSLLLTISSAGIPVAISRMVAHSLSRGEKRNALKIFKTAMISLIVLGTIATVSMIIFKDSFAHWVKDERQETVLGFLMIAPSVLIVCILSALRGFIQGQQEMKPTAISQLIEQLGKVAIGLPLAYIGMGLSEIFNLPPYASGATLALLGISISELLALIYMYIIYKGNKKQFESTLSSIKEPISSTKEILSQLFSIAIPITIGACIMPLSAFIDSGMIKGLLMKAGMNYDLAGSTYGRYAGIVITYINVPTALAIAVTTTTVPAISAGMSQNDHKYVKSQANLSLRYAFIIGLPASIGMSIMATPLIRIFFNNEMVYQTASMLRLSALTILFFTVVQATSGILQGMQKQRIPMYTLLLGVGIKVILNQLIIPLPSINIYGASISSLACYIISMVPNLYYVCKYSGLKFDWEMLVFRPFCSTLAMALLVLLSMKLLPTGFIFTIIHVLIGAASYIFFSIAFGSLTKEDIAMLKIKSRKDV